MSQNLQSDEIKLNFKNKVEELFPRIIQIINNLNLDSNIEGFTKIYENMLMIESEIEKLENNLDLNNISDLEERDRIINQKILKLFSPFICYYKLSLMQNM